MKIRAVVFLVFVLGTGISLWSQVKGYMSFSYLKGESGNASDGSFEGIRVGLYFLGDVSANIDYLAELHYTLDSSFDIDQAWLRLKPSEAFNLVLGLYRVPFGKYNLVNRPHQTSLVQAPLTVEYLYPERWRDIGLLAVGSLGNFFYSAYLGNGLAESENLAAGQQFRDNNADKGKGGRVGLSLSQWFEMAYSVYHCRYDDEGTRDLTSQGLDLTWSVDDFQLLAEYTRIRLENPENFTPGEAEGFFVQFVWNRSTLRPVVSYQQLRFEDGFHGKGFAGVGGAGQGISFERSRWALGIGYWLAPKAVIKLEYDFNREKENEVKNDVFILQIAVSF